jgi:hypothetical protein
VGGKEGSSEVGIRPVPEGNPEYLNLLNFFIFNILDELPDGQY